MPGRIVPLVTKEVYHVFNLGIGHRPTFTSTWEYKRFIQLLTFYSFLSPPSSFSRFENLSNDRKEILVYCLMPNHFHLLVRQAEDEGISTFISKLLNSYTRYFNVKNDSIGALFINQFKAVRMETEEQLLHVSRYIHLNPFTGYIVRDLESLSTYPWSSIQEYLAENHKGICRKDLINSNFKTPASHKNFIFDHADYQR